MAFKLGVVLAGGGSRGAYQIGVYQALLEAGVEYHIVTGTSVGALNGAMLVQRDYETARAFWLRLTAQDLAGVDISRAKEGPAAGAAIYAAFLRAAVRKGGADITGLEHIMRSVVDEGRFYASPVDFGLVTVKYPTLQPVTLVKREIPRGRLCDYLLASAACFPAFPTRLIGGERFIDGAWHDNLPINLALRLGADEILAVDLEGLGFKQRPHRRQVPITYIRPAHPLGPFLLFDPESAGRNLRLGYLDALRALGRAEGGAITLAPGTAATLCEALSPALLQARALLETAPQAAPPHPQPLLETILRLAKWYLLDVETLYTAHSYCYELLLRFNAAEALASEEIAASLAREDAAPQGLVKFGHRRLTEHIYARLVERSFGRSGLLELQRLSRLLAEETGAALFLFALKRHLAGEAP